MSLRRAGATGLAPPTLPRTSGLPTPGPRAVALSPAPSSSATLSASCHADARLTTTTSASFHRHPVANASRIQSDWNSDSNNNNKSNSTRKRRNDVIHRRPVNKRRSSNHKCPSRDSSSYSSPRLEAPQLPRTAPHGPSSPRHEHQQALLLAAPRTPASSPAAHDWPFDRGPSPAAALSPSTRPQRPPR